MLFVKNSSQQHQLQQQRQQHQQAIGMAKVTCHGAGLVSGDADLKNSFTVFVEKGNIGGISVAFEGKLLNKSDVNIKEKTYLHRD